MSRGQKQQIGSSNGQQQTMQKRGNRTLGWYLGVQQNNGGNGADEVEGGNLQFNIYFMIHQKKLKHIAFLLGVL